MTIPTRDELIDRAQGYWNAHTSQRAGFHICADFALSEIRRAVREELGEQTDKAGASERTRLRDESPAGNVAAPALSAADRLRAALEENRERYMDLPQWARDALIYKPGADPADLRESDFVRGLWPFDPDDRECAWRTLVEAYASGADGFGPSCLAAMAELAKELEFQPSKMWGASTFADLVSGTLRQRAAGVDVADLLA